MASGGSVIGQTIMTPDYGHEWAVIGEPGNRATYPNEVIRVGIFGAGFFPEYGSVGYVYRMRVTEVTAVGVRCRLHSLMPWGRCEAVSPWR